jgi:hypothetical protein
MLDEQSVARICGFFDLRTFVRFSSVSKRFAVLKESDYIWKIVDQTLRCNTLIINNLCTLTTLTHAKRLICNSKYITEVLLHQEYTRGYSAWRTSPGFDEMYIAMGSVFRSNVVWITGTNKVTAILDVTSDRKEMMDIVERVFTTL